MLEDKRTQGFKAYADQLRGVDAGRGKGNGEGCG
jgi:hypothetical protein